MQVIRQAVPARGGCCEGVSLRMPFVNVSPNTLRLYSLAAFLIGLLQPATIVFIGRMPLSEPLMFIVLLHCAIVLAQACALPVRLPSPRTFATLIVCQLVAFASYVVADIWRQSLPFDMIRGWLRMIFLLIDIAALSLLFGAGNRPFVLMLVGLSLSSVITFLKGPLFGDYWKFCFAYPITIVVLLAIPRYMGVWTTVAAAGGLGIVHLLMHFRSLGMQCLLLAVLLLSTKIVAQVYRKYVFLICLPLMLGALPWTVGRLLTDTGGRASRSNVERSAMLQAAWEGFIASPVVGNGSWFSRSDVWDNFLMIRSQKAFDAGKGLGFDSREFEGIAIHSQILTALAEGGLLGGTFFVAYAALLLLGFWFLLTEATWCWLTPIRLSILISSLSALIMSPFSGTARLEIAMAVALSLVLLDERRLAREERPARQRPLFRRPSPSRSLLEGPASTQ